MVTVTVEIYKYGRWLWLVFYCLFPHTFCYDLDVKNLMNIYRENKEKM